MAFAPVRKFTMDRRQFIKMTGAFGLASPLLSFDQLLAADKCEWVIPEIKKTAKDVQPGVLQYWIDGLHLGTRSDIKSRANVAVFMDLKQTDTSFVEAVLLVGPDKNTLGARYFDATMKMKDGHVPYVIFDNITLDATKTYSVIFTVREGSNVHLYTGAIDKPEISRLNTAFLPQQMRDDFKTFLVGNTANPTPGLITTPFQYYTQNGLSAHCARGRFLDIQANGSFQINIDFMHGDVKAEHYMRYFLVMDPVGRLLGFHKRSFGDPNNNGNGANTWTLSAITETQKTQFNIPPLQVADIRDCPYVMIYTEDSFDAIARSSIRLR